MKIGCRIALAADSIYKLFEGYNKLHSTIISHKTSYRLRCIFPLASAYLPMGLFGSRIVILLWLMNYFCCIFSHSRVVIPVISLKLRKKERSLANPESK